MNSWNLLFHGPTLLFLSPQSSSETTSCESVLVLLILWNITRAITHQGFLHLEESDTLSSLIFISGLSVASNSSCYFECCNTGNRIVTKHTMSSLISYSTTGVIVSGWLWFCTPWLCVRRDGKCHTLQLWTDVDSSSHTYPGRRSMGLSQRLRGTLERHHSFRGV